MLNPLKHEEIPEEEEGLASYESHLLQSQRSGLANKDRIVDQGEIRGEADQIPIFEIPRPYAYPIYQQENLNDQFSSTGRGSATAAAGKLSPRGATGPPPAGPLAAKDSSCSNKRERRAQND